MCGGANNQLAHPGVEKRLQDRGIVYAPDYCVNAGGLVQVAAERDGHGLEGRAAAGHRDLRHDSRACSNGPRAEGVPPSVAADRTAEQRMAEPAG